MSSISVVIITKNEAKIIEKTLDAVRWADEIIIVDSFSSDDTVAIARRYTDKVIQREWGGYGPQKAYAISLATQEWILSIDADEIVSPELAREIVETINLPEAKDTYWLDWQNYFMGRCLRFATCLHGHEYYIRLFRQGKAKLVASSLHEHFVPIGSEGYLNHPIHHYTADTIEARIAKINRYSSLAAQDAYAKGKHGHFILGVLLALRRFVGSYIRRQGFRDGWAGFIWSILRFFEEFLIYAKLVELERAEA